MTLWPPGKQVVGQSLFLELPALVRLGAQLHGELARRESGLRKCTALQELCKCSTAPTCTWMCGQIICSCCLAVARHGSRPCWSDSDSQLCTHDAFMRGAHLQDTSHVDQRSPRVSVHPERKQIVRRQQLVYLHSTTQHSMSTAGDAVSAACSHDSNDTDAF